MERLEGAARYGKSWAHDKTQNWAKASKSVHKWFLSFLLYQLCQIAFNLIQQIMKSILKCKVNLKAKST